MFEGTLKKRKFSFQRVCLFEPGREKFIEAKREMLSISNPEEGQIYHVSSISRDSIGMHMNVCSKDVDTLVYLPMVIHIDLVSLHKIK